MLASFITAAPLRAGLECPAGIVPEENMWVFSVPPYVEILPGIIETAAHVPAPGGSLGDDVWIGFSATPGPSGLLHIAKVGLFGARGLSFRGFDCSGWIFAAGDQFNSSQQDSVGEALRDIAAQISAQLGPGASLEVDYPEDFFPNGGCVIFTCQEDSFDDLDGDGVPDEDDNCR